MTKSIRVTFMLVVLFLIAGGASAQTETVIYNFCSVGGFCNDGAYPLSRLTFDDAGNLYGTTLDAGGSLGYYGNVFELSPNGTGGWKETTLYTFKGQADGANPRYCRLIFDGKGNLYGTASNAGTHGYGVVFELSPSGTGWNETVLYNFTNQADGGSPWSGLIMDDAGNLYGVTATGGPGNSGGVFELSFSGSGWTEQTIYAFNSKNSFMPSALAMDADGNIFGVAGLSIYELSPNGNGSWTPTVLHTYPGDFIGVAGTPVVDVNGNVFGTMMRETQKGIFEVGGVYRLTQKNGIWEMLVLKSWTHGLGPEGGVVLDGAGNIYGNTFGGGDNGQGSVFELVAVKGKSYQEKVLWSFKGGSDGSQPYGGVILDGLGNLYGTTYAGGSKNFGTVFEITP